MNVHGVDISPESIRVATKRAEANGVEVRFDELNVESGDLGEGCYDVVWCDLVLHHMVPMLDGVVTKLHRALRPGGLLIAREPVVYAAWLRTLRRLVPVRVDTTPDEQPFRRCDFEVVRRYFPNLETMAFRLFARADRITGDMRVLRPLARLDRVVLSLPGTTSLAGNVVMWAHREG
jgi:SAM-dependent methyltransferase